MNAFSHGLRASLPIVPGDDPAQWDQYRTAFLADVAPAGVIEAELAERVAVLSWRLRRVSAFESAACERAVLKVHFPIEKLHRNDHHGRWDAMFRPHHGKLSL